MGNDFAADTILLVGVRETAACGEEAGGVGGGREVNGVGANKKLGVTESERGGFVGSGGVFARAAEEEIGNTAHVGGGLKGRIGRDGGIGMAEEFLDDGDGYRFDPDGGIVGARVEGKLTGKPEVNFAKGVEADVVGPQ